MDNSGFVLILIIAHIYHGFDSAEALRINYFPAKSEASRSCLTFGVLQVEASHFNI